MGIYLEDSFDIPPYPTTLHFDRYKRVGTPTHSYFQGLLIAGSSCCVSLQQAQKSPASLAAFVRKYATISYYRNHIFLMSTEHQVAQFATKLKEYKKRYLQKRYAELDESATRLMVNSLLTEVLGYTELEEIKTEYQIRGEYADYVIQLARKKHFVVEVKAVQLDLNEKHLRQSTAYAANEGIDWIILTNGWQIEVYKMIFAKPISTKLVFKFNLNDPVDFKKAPQSLVLLSKKSVLRNELNNFWHRFDALEPKNLAKTLYSGDVIRLLRRMLKSKTGLTFNENDILDSVHHIITAKGEFVKPKCPIELSKKQTSKKETVPIAPLPVIAESPTTQTC